MRTGTGDTTTTSAAALPPAPTRPMPSGSYSGGRSGERFYDHALPAVDRHFVARRQEAHALPPGVDAGTFLTKLFRDGGAVWRIFWLHCCYPDRFPIYDQHVHRAMTFMSAGRRDELAACSDTQKVRYYLDDYLPFHQSFAGCDQRDADRALWACGKFLKTWRRFPAIGQP